MNWKLFSSPRRFWLLASGSAFLAGMIACSKMDDQAQVSSSSADLAAGAPVCQSGLEAFKTTLHPFVRERCAKCHTPDGGNDTLGPPHSVADAEAAYRLMTKYVVSAKLDTSKIVDHGGDMHCLSYGYDCKTTTKDILPVVQAWWDKGEKRCPHGLAIQSAELSIPKPLPKKKEGFARVRLKMETIKPEYKGLFFEFEIQRGADMDPNHPGSYLIQRPRFLSNNGNWRVRKLQFSLNDEVQPAGNVYSDSETLVSEDATAFDEMIWPTRVVSVDAAILIEKDAATDKIKVGFGEIFKVPESDKCHDLDMFKEKMMPTIERLGCQHCHGGDAANPGADPNAKARMSLDGNDEFICKQFAKQGQKTNYMLSPILWFPLHSSTVHPWVIPFPEAVLPEWGEWLQKGN